MVKKVLITLGILGAIAAAVVFGVRRSKASSEVKYVSVPVERGKLIARVTATGTVSALVTVQVGAQVSGRIAELKADFNSPVKKGQVIARIDPQLYAAAVEQARANVAVQTGQLEQARANARNLELIRKRNRQLRAEKLVAQADLDTAEAQADAASANVKAQEGQLEQARATLHQAEVNLNYTTILSPTDGTVISRNVDVGQTVAAALQAPTLFTIAQDLKKMQVDTSVAEADVGKLTPGMPATFTVDAYPSERFKGKVRQIRNAPQTVQNVVTYDAVIDVDNSELKLKPGMTANVTFVFADKDDVLKVPNAALRYRPPMDGEKPQKRKHGAPSDERSVWVLDGPKPREVTIKVGFTDGSATEVTSGLAEGQRVVTETVGDKAAAPRSPFGRGF